MSGSAALARLVTRTWYAPRATPLARVLQPLSWLFGIIASLRRAAYRRDLLHAERLPVPVVVVGNITAGGSGKTPLVVALVEAIRARGRRPGIVSRGYGRRDSATRAVAVDDDPRQTGDEPLILAATGVPVWIGADRPAAARGLLAANPRVDVIVADDGLQHYALARDVEIAVVDDSRGLGNGLLLPAGPLREPRARLGDVDAVVRLHATPAVRSGVEFAMTHEPGRWTNITDPALAFDGAALRDPSTVAIAGIAHPDRFFAGLRAGGFAGRTRAFADHHDYTRDDVAFPGARAILMTEKDAVKCRAFGDARMWMLPIRARVDASLVDVIMEKLDGSQAARDARLSGDQGTAHP